MYRFTTEELLAWRENPHINPVTQKPINPSSKKGVAAELSRQWEIYETLQKNMNKTAQFPLDVVYHIFRKTFHEQQENLQKVVDFIWKQHITRDPRQLLRVRSIQQLFDNPEESMYRATFLDNGFLYVGDFTNCFYIKKQRVMFMYLPQLKDNITSFSFVFSYFSHPFSSIYYDNQYCTNYDITRTFWRNMMPEISFDAHVDHEKGDIALKCDLVVENENLTRIIPLHQLKKDMHDNDGHPLLKAYREAVRIWMHSLSHLMELFEPLKTSSDTMMQLYRSLAIMKKNVLDDKDISAWNVTMKGGNSNSLLKLKFGNDHILHKQRLQTLVQGPHRKKIFI